MGLDPASGEAHHAIGLVRDHVTWQGSGPPECDDNPFFAGEVEPCINGTAVTVGSYFGEDVGRLAAAVPDGGELGQVGGLLRLGADPAQAWASLTDPALAPVAKLRVSPTTSEGGVRLAT